MTYTRTTWIAHIGPKAKAVCKGTPFFASVMIAQSVLESGNGNSKLTKLGNNLFGIKALGGWKGSTLDMKTGEAVKGVCCVLERGDFRAYDSIEDSMRDRNKFLIDNPRYKRAGVLDAKTPEEQCDALQKAGYATDPRYAQKLKDIINGSGRLKRFD